MTQKIFRSTIFVAAVVLLCSLSIIMGVLYDYSDDVQIGQLQDELRIAAVGTELEGKVFLKALDAQDFRVTWVAADGTVLYDTNADESAMENHADREEIREALETGFGSSVRDSATLLERTVYEAMRLRDGTVLRISRNRQTLLLLAVEMLNPVVLVAAIAIVLSALLANRMSRKIVEPLNTLDLEHPLQNDVYDEVLPLLRRINQLHLQIDQQLKTLKRKTDEFEQITLSMREGLVLLDSEGTILSLNPTARTLFRLEGDCVGKPFLTVDRSREMRAAVNEALDNGHASTRARHNGRDYQFDLSRMASDGKNIGAVILAFDITETLNAERTRREFSANVSHELKTPLQSIIGSAELLENGLVKPEDTPRFVGHIRTEATRLVTLIEDIIRLSQLDEGVGIPMEEVSLLPLAEEVAAVLQKAAQEKNVAVLVSGESRTVSGVRRLLYEVIYNLCDNAIKYNIPGGTVRVTVGAHNGHTVLKVSDTGIGIAQEHHARVFERFYRVDKSHSKQSGGTGLGLSIVKNALRYHKAQLELESAPGEGTTITVIF